MGQHDLNPLLQFGRHHKAFLLASSASPPTEAGKCSVPEHSSTAVPVASDAAVGGAASPGFIKAAIGAVDTMEETMRLLTYLELTRCTKPQLWHLYSQILAALPGLPEGTRERANAMLNIQHIRMFLARRDYTLC